MSIYISHRTSEEHWPSTTLVRLSGLALALCLGACNKGSASTQGPFVTPGVTEEDGGAGGNSQCDEEDCNLSCAAVGGTCSDGACLCNKQPPLPSPDGGAPTPPDQLTDLLLFHSDRGGNLDVYISNADGTEATQLTTDGAEDSHPTVSWGTEKNADGSYAYQVVFQTNRHGAYDLYRMDLIIDREHKVGAPRLTRLTDDGANYTQPSLSHDGRFVAFVSDRDGDDDLYLMDLKNGDSVRQLTKNTVSDDHPAFSPDGRKVYFRSARDHSQGEIYYMNATDGSAVTRVTTNELVDAYPALSPDGTRLAIVRGTVQPERSERVCGTQGPLGTCWEWTTVVHPSVSELNVWEVDSLKGESETQLTTDNGGKLWSTYDTAGSSLFYDGVGGDRDLEIYWLGLSNRGGDQITDGNNRSSHPSVTSGLRLGQVL